MKDHHLESPYLLLLSYILRNGTPKGDRTGTGTLSVFGAQMRFDLSDRFPLLTTKKVHWKSIVYELLWFLRGDTNTDYLHRHSVTIWDEWANENGDLGPVYGKQWRSWSNPKIENREIDRAESGLITERVLVGEEPIDQIANVVESIRANPDGRRHIVTAWNPAEVEQAALPPCHCLFQFYVADGRLSCQLYQRSADMFLGVPFNIASYALLTCMMADVTGLKRGTFIHTLGDAHIYLNHTEQVRLQLSRQPLPSPKLHLAYHSNIFDYNYDDIHLADYESHPAIPAPVAK